MRKLMEAIGLVCLVSILCASAANAQREMTSGGITSQTLESFLEKPQTFERFRSNDHYYLLLQFDQLPTSAQKETLSKANIHLIQYKNNNTYLAAVPALADKQTLDRAGIRGVQKTDSFDKLSAEFFKDEITEKIENGEALDLALVFSPHAKDTEIQALFERHGIRQVEKSMSGAPVRIIRLPSDLLDDIASEPLVVSLDIRQEEDVKLNHEVCVQQRVNALNSSLVGERNLSGEGVVIGVGDGGELGDHIDFGCRIINKADGSYSSFGQHGDHVAGIIGGGGIIDPIYQGMAADANLLIQKTSLITFYAEDYIRDHNMVLTNNSYGTSFNCASNGTYNYTSLTLDWQMNEYPNILHVFAAGNSGNSTCGSYPKGYKTVLRYYQSSKNVLTVGAVTDDRDIWSSSSRGPVADGRIKPEICGIGTRVHSTGRDYNYWVANGTSMAAPAVTGTLGLLYQRYRQLHAGQDPDGAFLKALVCNTADDLGNPGPDYIYGFGLVNGLRAVEAMENNQFFKASLEQGGANEQTINVPAGVSQMKVMLYWSDKEAESFPEKALVNDLDLTVVAPDGTTYLPWILNPDTNHVADNAVRGADHLNNIEQVTIDLPSSGQYTLRINGTEVPFGPQTFHIVYDFVEPEIKLTHPMGGEFLKPGTQEMIQWDADSSPGNSYTVEYSTDNGANWTVLTNSLAGTNCFYEWTVPDVETSEAKVRVSRNGTPLSATSQVNFNVRPVPAELSTKPYCDGMVQLDWTGVDYASEYEVMFFNGCDWEVVKTSTSESAVIDNNLEDGAQYWFTVRAVGADGLAGKRATAASCIVDANALCPWGVAPRFEDLLVPDRGRSGTITTLDIIKMFGQIRNIGQDTLFDYDIFFSLDNEPPISIRMNQVIAPGDSLVLDFGSSVDCSDPGTHTFNAWVSVEEDGQTYLDTLETPVKVVQLDNPELNFPFAIDFGQAAGNQYASNRLGVDGLDFLDYNTNGIGGLSFPNGSLQLASIEDDGNVTIDNEVIFTLNVGKRNEDANKHVLLNFQFASEVDEDAPLSNSLVDTIWARGVDTDEWVYVASLDGSNTSWSTINGLDITAAITTAGQSHSSSTQVRFQQRSSRGLILGSMNAEFDVPLPVELGLFEAKKEAPHVLLHWQTVEEINSDYFEIEMAIGEDQIAAVNFQSLGRVEAVGNSVDTQDYYFLDKVIHAIGNRYYRLKMVDLDGSFEYSPLRVVYFEETDLRARVYPNPFQDEIYLQLAKPSAQNIRLELWDIRGVRLRSDEISYQPGQVVRLPESEQLPPGAYILNVWSGESREQFRILKQ